MSSRIEKGGARFKPSVVKRRTATSSSNNAASPSTPQPAKPAATAASPTLSAAGSSVLLSPSLRPTLPPPIAGGSVGSSSTSTSKSFAFATPPTRISVGRSAPASTSAQNASSPVFKRPSVARQAPGLRSSITPGPSRTARTLSFPPIAALPSSVTAPNASEGAESDAGPSQPTPVRPPKSPVQTTKSPVRPPKTTVRPPAASTVSDDEREYMEQVEAEGYTLAGSRLDPSVTLMGDISSVNYKKGRAGPRTFELDRVRRTQEEERRAARLSQNAADLTPKQPSASPAPEASGSSLLDRISNDFIEGEEEIVADDEDEGDEAASSAGDELPASQRRQRRRAPSIAGTEHSFSENRFAVQTRIVDGRIVVDETSLFANYGNGEDDRDGMEVIDEREGDHFVNSATRGKGVGRLKKWSKEDTAKFFKAVQQWGTDFEMISRLFPGRDRVMIKKKWNIEERANPKLVDDALNNRLAIDLDAYALAAGVDLSGPPPEINADLVDMSSLAPTAEELAKVKKREGTAPAPEDDDDEYEYEEEIEIDEHGNETVIRKRLGKKASAKRKSKSKKSQPPEPTDEAPPVAPTAAVAPEAEASNAADTRPPTIGTRSKRQRGNSIASSSAAGAGMGTRTRRMSRTEPTVVDREKRHRASTLRGGDAPTDRMEVEEIIGDA